MRAVEEYLRYLLGLELEPWLRIEGRLESRRSSDLRRWLTSTCNKALDFGIFT